jgi:hypothetical protein
MIYEVRTYTLAPGGVPKFEAAFAEALPHREKYSKLGAFWHTEIGPLNQVIHVWPYEDLDERTEIRAEAAKDAHWPPRNEPGVLLNMESEIMLPAPFMRPMGNQQLGNIYEMRSYDYQPGSIPEVIKLWSEAIPHREEFSPLAAAWYSELGGLNKWVHVWPYKSLGERDRIRAEASTNPHWPPPTRQYLVKQQTKILVPASFSPMK